MNGASKTTSLALAQYVEGGEAWGTQLGARVFGELNTILVSLDEGATVQFDYGGLKRSDVSFQREAVVETLRKHRPRICFIAVNLVDPDIRLNLSFALEKYEESLLVAEASGESSVVGRRLTPEQQNVLELVRASGELTSTRLTDPPLLLKPSTASNQLTMLWRAGLIRRVEGAAASGGREYRYYPVVLVRHSQTTA